MDEKMHLLEQHRSTFGLNRCLQALGLSKGTYYHRQQRRSQAERDEALRQRVVAVIERHPDYGYRRILAELQAQQATAETAGPVNHKRLRRVLRAYELSLRRSLPASSSAVQRVIRRAGPSVNLVRGRAFAALEVFSTDFTELRWAEGHRKAHLMVLLCLESRWAGGWSVGLSANRQLALQALGHLHERLARYGRTLEGVIVHHDQDSVYTSYDWARRVLIKEQARLSYAEHGARDNPWVESLWGRFKTENSEALLTCETLEEVVQLVNEKLTYYNHERRHSALGYQRPVEVLLRIINRGDATPDP